MTGGHPIVMTSLTLIPQPKIFTKTLLKNKAWGHQNRLEVCIHPHSPKIFPKKLFFQRGYPPKIRRPKLLIPLWQIFLKNRIHITPNKNSLRAVLKRSNASKTRSNCIYDNQCLIGSSGSKFGSFEKNISPSTQTPYCPSQTRMTFGSFS